MNSSYYLYTNTWYFTVSPMHLFSNGTNAMINIKKDGYFQSAYTGHPEGGVQVTLFFCISIMLLNRVMPRLDN